MSRFPLGQLEATPRALEVFKEGSYWPYVARHGQGDWGDISQEDKAENELSLKCGFRLLSAYTLPGGKRIWIITEADRSATTIWTPEDY
jgi:hypothetical protein